MIKNDMAGRVDVAAAKLIDLLVANSGNETLQVLHEHFKPVVRMQVMQTLGPDSEIGRKAKRFAKKFEAFNRMCDPIKNFNEAKSRHEDVQAKVEVLEPEVIEVKSE